MSACEQSASVGAYVLKALDDTEAREFETHLHVCDECRKEASELRFVADTLPLAAPQVAPPRELRDRIMAVVRSEADLLQAAGADVESAPPAKPTTKRSWLPRWGRGPAMAVGAGACAALAAVIVATAGDPSTRTVTASLAPSGAHVSVKVTGHRAELTVSGMPSPSAGRVYEVWLVRAGKPPRPTHALFGVRDDGRAVVKIPESVAKADAIWVTAEPSRGGAVPTSAPVIKASLS
jgi:hypothetical protein